MGRVTKAGLDQPVGAAAINSVPRRMIETAVAEVLEEAGLDRTVEILIFVPGGERTAEKTFNPVLGITGGISILGTSGIVEPMSEEALIETIRAHMQVLRSEGRRFAAAVPGNMGERFLWCLSGAGGDRKKYRRWCAAILWAGPWIWPESWAFPVFSWRVTWESW